MKKPITIIPTWVLRQKFKDIKTKILLIEIYAEANFSRTVINGQEMLPGQAKTTLSQLMERTGLSRKEVRNRLDYLCSLGYINKKSNHHFMIITLVGYAEAIARKETSGAQSGAHVTQCLSTNSTISQIYMGTKEDTPKAYINNNKKNNVGASTADVPIEERQNNLRQDVLDFIDQRGYGESLQIIPELKNAVNNFLSYYGVVDDTGLMKCEKIRNFRVEFHLTKWLRNENSLKNIIKI